MGIQVPHLMLIDGRELGAGSLPVEGDQKGKNRRAGVAGCGLREENTIYT